MCTVVQMPNSHNRTPMFHLPQVPEEKQRWLKATHQMQKIQYSENIIGLPNVEN